MNKIIDDQQDERVILGHVSMLTSMAISACGKFLATSDRDEKIRISSLPDTYNIIHFLLGHKKYVYGLEFCNDSETLLSCGGDNRIIQWDIKSGQIKQILQLSEILKEDISKAMITGLKVINTTALILLANPHKLILYPLTGSVSPLAVDVSSVPIDFCCFKSNETTCFILLLTCTSENVYQFITCELDLENPKVNMKKTDLFKPCSELNSKLSDEIPKPHPKMEFLDSLTKSIIDVSGKDAYERNKEQHHKSILERRHRHQRNREQKRRRKNNSDDELS
ncbi:hypothetical protein Ciccas_007808 [Cichlidogyrus casuarinus]|uniref:Uncharacterized protein n=1 Tax=Cichlidogyrus casuarinus TaxID=1844966 RepID=A0ABD2Q1S8_9PLAT